MAIWITADDPSMSETVNFGPIVPEFADAFAPGGLHAGLCHAF